MVNIFYISFFLLTTSLFAQEMDYNTKKGYVAEGYDVVAYFDNSAIEGDKKFSTNYDDVNYKFSTRENLKTFITNPKKFIPQYGVYCAYALADKGKKVGINPETFLVADGKLYLFYNVWATNTLELWNKEDPIILKQRADKNWITILKHE